MIINAICTNVNSNIIKIIFIVEYIWSIIIKIYVTDFNTAFLLPEFIFCFVL